MSTRNDVSPNRGWRTRRAGRRPAHPGPRRRTRGDPASTRSQKSASPTWRGPRVSADRPSIGAGPTSTRSCATSANGRSAGSLPLYGDNATAYTVRASRRDRSDRSRGRRDPAMTSCSPELWRGRPEFLLPVFDRLGSSQLSLLNLIAESIEQGQADGGSARATPTNSQPWSC